MYILYYIDRHGTTWYLEKYKRNGSELLTNEWCYSIRKYKTLTGARRAKKRLSHNYIIKWVV